MNEHDLSASLRAIHGDRGALRAPGLDQRIRGIDFDTIPQQRSWLLQLPQWRSGTLFSATKLVVAGAVVALFGGYLLAGLLPVQTAVDQTPTAAISDLVPSVDLKVDEVRPGVFRVRSDGVRPLSKDVMDVAVTPGGDIWVTKARLRKNGDLGKGRVIRLGDPKASLQRDHTWLTVGVDLGGAPVARLGNTRGHEPGLLRFDGTEWIGLDAYGTEDYYPTCLIGLTGYAGTTGGLAADGSCWSMGYAGVPIRVYEDQSEEMYLEPGTAGLDLGGRLYGVAVDQAGTLWTAHLAGEPMDVWGFEGLISFDGETWSSIPYSGPDVPLSDYFVEDIAPGEDGVIRVLLAGRKDRLGTYVVTWDGQSWAAYGPVGSRPPSFGGTHRLPDGRILFGGQAVLAGEDLSLFDPLGLGPDTPYGPTDVMPNGTVLTIVWSAWTDAGDGYNGGLYVIWPDAVTAAG